MNIKTAHFPQRLIGAPLVKIGIGLVCDSRLPAPLKFLDRAVGRLSQVLQVFANR